MKKITAILMSALALGACEKKVHPVYHTADGSYYTQDDAGNWLMLYLIINGQQTAYTSPPSTGTPRAFSPPAGASWSAAKSAPSKQEIEEAEEEPVSESEEAEDGADAGGDTESDAESGSDGGSDAGGGE